MTVYAGMDLRDRPEHICLVNSSGAVLQTTVGASDPDVLAK